MIHCNTGFVLHSYIIKMWVSFVDVARKAEPRNPYVLVFLFMLPSSASIQAYSTWNIS